MKKTIYFNRDLSWIEFNARVLHEASRKDLPLMERLKFLGIVASNFDEFFQVRVASIKRLAAENPTEKDISEQTPSQILKKISERCHQIFKQEYEILNNDVLPSLARARIIYVNPNNYSTAQKAATETIFKHNIFPVLTPLRTDNEFFPHIGNNVLTAAFLIKPLEGIHIKKSELTPKSNEDILALVQIPSTLPRIVWLPGNDNTHEFTVLDDIIAFYGKELFPGYEVTETMLFKVDRDADFSVDEDSGENFIQAMKDVLIKRQSSFPVRMVCNTSSTKILSTIQQKLNLSEDEVYQVNSFIDPTALIDLTNMEGISDYLYPEWKHFYPDDLPENETYWNTLRQKDILLQVPYQSYDPVVKFIKDAAHDNNVLAIKITLYRTGNNSPIVQALKEAAQSGKQVTAFLELKARFDEERNISWATELENAGVIVIYGVVNLKVHAKACLVIRKEEDGIRRYAHFSTGNYNPKTALVYQDYSLFTSNPDLVSDSTLFFNVISGYTAMPVMHNLYMAPLTLKNRLIEMIEREIQQTTPDNPGLIIAKMNSLCHKEIIEELYKASKAGVQILLNVRGICTIIPGLRDISENIKVISIVDRYLEHSRIFYFQNGGNEELYLSSADWMERNLDKRIELMVPVRDSKVFKTIKDNLLLYFQDNTHAYKLLTDGSWKPLAKNKKELSVSAQEVLYKKYKKRNEMKKSLPKVEFIVRRKN